MRTYRVTFSAPFALCLATAVGAQRPAVLSGGATCAACSIVSQPIAVIGSTDGPGALTAEAPLISRDGRGRYYTFGGNQTISVYSPTGAFLRSIGRIGSGPGEYRLVSGVQGVSGDSLVVFDAGLRRMTMLAPDYSVVRTVPVAAAGGEPIVLPHTGSQVVLNAADARHGPALFALDLTTGRIVRSFAAADGTPFAQLPEGTWRRIAADPSGAVWMSYMTRYTLELWAANGSRTAIITRDIPWFPETRAPGAYARAEPEPTILSIDVDSAGRLWVLAALPDSRWRDAIRVVPGRPRPEITDPLKYRDAMLEVIDPFTGRVVVSQRFDEPMLTLLPGQLVVQVVEDAEGRPTLRISKLTLRER